MKSQCSQLVSNAQSTWKKLYCRPHGTKQKCLKVAVKLGKKLGKNTILFLNLRTLAVVILTKSYKTWVGWRKKAQTVWYGDKTQLFFCKWQNFPFPLQSNTVFGMYAANVLCFQRTKANKKPTCDNEATKGGLQFSPSAGALQAHDNFYFSPFFQCAWGRISCRSWILKGVDVTFEVLVVCH